MGHLGPRMSHPVSRKDVRSHNSGLAVRIAFSIFTMKGAKRDIEIILMVFLKKSYCIQSNLIILEQKWYGVLFTLTLFSGFFINFTQEKESRAI